MANPPPYEPGYNYSGFENSNPTKPKPGLQLDNDFANLGRIYGALREKLMDLLRSDGALRNGIVTPDTLSPAVKAMMGNYEAGELVLELTEMVDQIKAPPYTPFTGYAEAAATPIPHGVTYFDVAQYRFVRDPLGTALSTPDGANWSPVGDVYPEHFGAVGDGVTDDTAACQAWADFLRKNGRNGRMNGRAYRVTSLQMMPEKVYSISGDNFHESVFFVVNPSRTAVGVNFGHADETARVQVGVRVDNVRVRAGIGTKACLVQFARNNDLQIFRMKVSGFHGATGIRAYGLWNCDLKEVTVYGCGHNIPSKDVPAGARFSITNGTKTLTSNVDVFASTDVDMNITVFNADQSGGQRHTIRTVNGPRSVTVDDNQVGQTVTNGFGTFGGVRAQINAASATATFGRALTSDDVGRIVYILEAGKMSGTADRLPLRARIESVSGNTAQLSKTAAFTTGWVETIFDPAVDFGEPDDNLVNGQTNDSTFTDLHIEQHAGCGLVGFGVRTYFTNLKLHGYPMTETSGQNNQATNIQALFYYTNAEITGAFEQVVCGNLARIVCSRIKAMQLGYVETLGIHRLPLIQQFNGSNAKADIGSVVFYGNTTDEVFNGMIGPGQFRQYGTTTASSRPGVAKQHGSPIEFFS